jgi:hypothetical protein
VAGRPNTFARPEDEEESKKKLRNHLLNNKENEVKISFVRGTFEILPTLSVGNNWQRRPIFQSDMAAV